MRESGRACWSLAEEREGENMKRWVLMVECGEVRFGKTLFSSNLEKDCGKATRVEDDLDVVDDDDGDDDDACRLMWMKIVLE